MIILDFEASGIMKGSFPIEIAWIRDSGTAISTLIQPSDNWLSNENLWSERSQNVHGIEKATLISEGLDIKSVIDLIVNDIKEYETIYSDNPSFEQEWLDRLFDEARISHNYIVRDFNVMLNNISDPYSMEGAYYQARKISPPTHRAQRDVEYLLTVYNILKNCDYK